MKAKVKEKVCRNKECQKKFRTFNSLQVACSKKCAVAIQKVHCVLKKKPEIFEVDKTTTTAYKKKQLQIVINEIVRLIDKDLPCVSCSNDHTPQAGHYHSIGSKPYLRFNLNNIHLQGHKCNIELTGNRSEYLRGLASRYGIGYANMVDNVLVQRFRNVKLSDKDLNEAITKAKACLTELKNRIIPIETNTERMKLRLIYNNRIGIYKIY